MIGKLKGTIDEIGDDYVLVDVHGVCYVAHCSSRTLGRIGSAAADCLARAIARAVYVGGALDAAEAKVDAAFEFFTKLGVPYWCFHDIDLAPDADDIGQYEKNLKHMVALAKTRQDATGIKLLWGTANLFSHPRYMNGASTNPDFAVVARAAVQVKAALPLTHLQRNPRPTGRRA